MKINVLVSCGSGLVTSSLVEDSLKEIAIKEGFDLNFIKVGMTGISSFIEEADILVSTSKYTEDIGDKPALAANSLLSGIGIDEFRLEFVNAIREIERKKELEHH